MKAFLETIERDFENANVLIVGASETMSSPLATSLRERGVQLIGVAASAAHALTMVAQIPIDAAVIVGDAEHEGLVERLKKTWGVPSLVVDPATLGA